MNKKKQYKLINKAFAGCEDGGQQSFQPLAYPIYRYPISQWVDLPRWQARAFQGAGLLVLEGGVGHVPPYLLGLTCVTYEARNGAHLLSENVSYV